MTAFTPSCFFAVTANFGYGRKISATERESGCPLSAERVIETLNLAKEVSSAVPVKAMFGIVGILLGMIRLCLVISLL